VKIQKSGSFILLLLLLLWFGYKKGTKFFFPEADFRLIKDYQIEIYHDSTLNCITKTNKFFRSSLNLSNTKNAIVFRGSCEKEILQIATDSKSNILALLLTEVVSTTIPGLEKDVQLLVVNTLSNDTLLCKSFSQAYGRIKLFDVNSTKVLLGGWDSTKNMNIREECFYNPGLLLVDFFENCEYIIKEPVMGAHFFKNDNMIIVQRSKVIVGSPETGFKMFVELEWPHRFGYSPSLYRNCFLVTMVKYGALWKGFHKVEKMILYDSDNEDFL